MTLELLHAAGLSAVPGVTHAFTTRNGGHSHAPFDSLNLGLHVGDSPAAVQANRERVIAALAVPQAAWVSVQQVHGDTVVEVTRQAGRAIEADGLIMRDQCAAIAVLVADCVPILAAAVDGSVVAAVHAGWRGTAAGIVARAIERLAALGIAPARLRLALGPAIGPCCYAVGAEVAERLSAATPRAAEAVRQESDGSWRADLWQLNRLIAEQAGVPSDQIDVLRLCTCCRAELFSHRRDSGRTGRQAGVIARVR